MISIIDTHVHPDIIVEYEKEKSNISVSFEDIIAQARGKYVKKMFCISTNIKDFLFVRKLSSLHNEFFFSLGIHPCHVYPDVDEGGLNLLESVVSESIEKKEKIIAIGEVGVDCYRQKDQDHIDLQIKSFEYQIELAIKNNLPLVIHTRHALDITYDILKKYAGRVRGVIHAFQDSYEYAKKFVDIGFMLGIGGFITYPKNEYIRDAIKKIGIQHLMLETDAPFLPIQSMRGKVNYPGYTYDIGIFAADLYGIAKESFFEIIYKNTENLFLF